LRLAEKVAASSSMKQKHGAVIVKGGRVMSIGHNKWRNHPDIIEEDKIKQVCSVHAEVDAISRVADTRNAVIYIARVNNGGLPVMSRPCDNCYESILNAGITKIIHT